MAPDTAFATPAARWHAVSARIPAATAAFVYAVLTTRIYCRPTCHARLPRRANVAFYDTPAAAVAAGFRACKRCKPEQALGASEEQVQRRVVGRACEVVAEKGGVVTLKEVAAEVGLSARYFHGAFKAVMGVTLGVYAKRRREELAAAAAAEGLEVDEAGLQEAAASVSVPPSLCYATDNSSGFATPNTETTLASPLIDDCLGFEMNGGVAQPALFDPSMPSNALFGYEGEPWNLLHDTLAWQPGPLQKESSEFVRELFGFGIEDLPASQRVLLET